MTTSRRVKFGPFVAVAAMLVCVGSVLAQPSDDIFDKTCNAGVCVSAGNTTARCAYGFEGCCCKNSTTLIWECVCRTSYDCDNAGSSVCRPNTVR